MKIYHPGVLEKIAGLCSVLAGVIEEQYSVYYFQHTFTEKELTATQKAPLHNILSVRLLGSVDIWVRKPPNASIYFVSSVLKAKYNNAMEWLLLKSYEEREKLIRFSIGVGRVCRGIRMERILDCRQRKLTQIKMKVQIRDSKYRRSIETTLKQVNVGEELDIAFLNIDLHDIYDTLQIILSNPKVMMHQQILQWFAVDKESGTKKKIQRKN